MAKKPTIALLTPEIRQSFPALITPREGIDDEGKKTGKWAYSVEGLFDEDKLTQFRMYDDASQKYVNVDIREALTQLSKTAWPNLDPQALFQGQSGRGWPLKKGDALKAKRESKGKKGDHYAGLRVIALKSNVAEGVQPPSLSQQLQGDNYKKFDRTVDADMAKAKLLFVGGNYAWAAVSFVANVVSGLHYLTAYMNGVRYTREGAKFGGQNEMDRFDGISGGSAAHNPMQGMTNSDIVDF